MCFCLYEYKNTHTLLCIGETGGTPKKDHTTTRDANYWKQFLAYLYHIIVGVATITLGG